MEYVREDGVSEETPSGLGAHQQRPAYIQTPVAAEGRASASVQPSAAEAGPSSYQLLIADLCLRDYRSHTAAAAH